MSANAEDKRIFSLRRKGSTLKEIAQAVGLSPATVRVRLLQSGMFPGRVPLRNRFPEEKARVIFSMYKKGSSLREIGAVVGYSYETVRTVLNKNGRSAAIPPLHCSIRGCKDVYFALGYCHKHWTRARTGRMDDRGNLVPIQRFCEQCGREFFCPPEPYPARSCARCRWKRSKPTTRRASKGRARRRRR